MSTVEQETIQGELVANQIEAPIRFSVTDEAIRTLKKKLTGLDAKTSDGYKRVQAGIAETRMLRGNVESTRKALKEKALTYGRLVDSEAKRITGLLEEIENPLKLLKSEVDEAKQREKEAIESARRAEIERRVKRFEELEYAINPYAVAEMSAVEYADEVVKAKDLHDALVKKREHDAAEKAEADRLERETREAERAELLRLRAEQADRDKEAAIERQLLAAKQAKIDEQNKIEREAIEAERKAVEAKQDEIDRQESLRQGKIRDEQEAAERSRQERLAEAEHAKRMEAMKPDIQKIHAFGDVLRLLNYPVLMTAEGAAFMSHLKERVDMLAISCEGFES